MWVTRLALTHFRNYAQEEMRPASGVNLLLGDNAQGKSNLLEALVCLSTTRSFRTTVERSLINRALVDEPIPYARLVAHLESGPVRVVELVITIEPENGTPRSVRHLRLDGVPRRLMDALGTLPTVLFTPDDVALVAGPPAGRRHYLDVLLCQASRDYCRALLLYNRSLLQRNSLLRRIGEHEARPDELTYWDDEMAAQGAYIILARQEALAQLDTMARDINGQLTDGQEHLHIVYRSTLDTSSDISGAFRDALAHKRQRDIAAGMSLVGPHRDDLSFLADGVDMRVYGSRGQQRTVALSLKFAEARYMCGIAGEEPILLLDDIMSELDGHRRLWVLQSIDGGGQVIITATETDHYTREFLSRTAVMRVHDSTIT